MYAGLEVIFEDNLLVGESPVWDEKKKKLFFVDIRGKCFYDMDYYTGEYRKTDVGELIGCLALCKNDDLLLSMESGIYRYSIANKSMSLAHQKTTIKGEHFNDGKVGPDGVYYVGTAGQNFSGAFYRLKNGILEELFDGCGCSNGLDWDLDTGRMIYCDSRKQKLESFKFLADTHSLCDRSEICGMDENFGSGDGLAIDLAGNIWLAVWGGSCVLHIEQTTGRILHKIDIPATQVSSCCFAGDDFRDLVITTAAVRLDLTLEPMAGKIFRYKTDIPGKAFYRY